MPQKEAIKRIRLLTDDLVEEFAAYGRIETKWKDNIGKTRICLGSHFVMYAEAVVEKEFVFVTIDVPSLFFLFKEASKHFLQVRIKRALDS